jgi:hypothetical protein
MDKILISELNRYLDIMGISQKRLITEQAGGLYDLIRSYLLPAFRKVRHIPATPNSYERYILDLEQGVSQTGERLTKEMELTPGEYNALWGQRGALRVNGAIDDFAELGLNDAGRSALFRLINNFSQSERKLLYQAGVDDFIRRSQSPQGIIINGQRLPQINTKDDLIQMLANVARNNYNGSAQRMIQDNFDDFTYEVLGGSFIKDVEDFLNNKYVKGIGDIDPNFAEAEGRFLSAAGFRSWVRMNEPSWLKWYRQRYVITTVPGSGMIRIGGEYWMPESMLARKIEERVASIRGKIEGIANNPRNQKGTLEDTIALWYSVNNTKQWITESLEGEWERWIVNNKYLKASDLEELKKKPWYKSALQAEVIPQSDVHWKFFTDNFRGLARLIPGVSFFKTMVDEGWKKAIRSVGTELGYWSRAFNFIVFRTPLSFDKMVANTARTGQYSGVLGLVFSNIFIHMGFLPLVMATAETWANNLVVRQVNDDVEQMKEWCKSLNFEGCQDLEELEHPILEEWTKNWQEDLPLIGTAYKQGLGEKVKSIPYDLTYLDEFKTMIDYIFTQELFGEGVVEGLKEGYNELKKDADKKFMDQLIKKIPSMTSYVNEDREVLYEKLAEYCKQNPKECTSNSNKEEEKKDEEKKDEGESVLDRLTEAGKKIIVDKFFKNLPCYEDVLDKNFGDRGVEVKELNKMEIKFLYDSEYPDQDLNWYVDIKITTSGVEYIFDDEEKNKLGC